MLWSTSCKPQHYIFHQTNKYAPMFLMVSTRSCKILDAGWLVTSTLFSQDFILPHSTEGNPTFWWFAAARNNGKTGEQFTQLVIMNLSPVEVPAAAPSWKWPEEWKSIFLRMRDPSLSTLKCPGRHCKLTNRVFRSFLHVLYLPATQKAPI